MRAGGFGLCPVRRVHRFQVAIDALLDLSHACLQLGARDVAVTVVDRFELAAFDDDDRFGEEIKCPAEDDELATGVADGFAVIAPEAGDGLEVRRQPFGQPNEFNVALCFAFQSPTGLDSVQVALDVELEPHGRVIAGASRCSGDDAFKPE